MKNPLTGEAAFERTRMQPAQGRGGLIISGKAGTFRCFAERSRTVYRLAIRFLIASGWKPLTALPPAAVTGMPMKPRLSTSR